MENVSYYLWALVFAILVKPALQLEKMHVVSAWVIPASDSDSQILRRSIIMGDRIA